MTDKEFATWASNCGLPEDAVEEILQFAASPEEMKKSIDDVEPAPPIYTFDDIVEMTDKDPYGISPRANGFLVVGGCPNGDPIALDVADMPGSVWYIDHETMSYKPVRTVSIRVAANLSEMLEGMVKGTFPFDYYEAVEQADKSKG